MTADRTDEIRLRIMLDREYNCLERLTAAKARVTRLEDLLAERAEYGEWTHVHCDETSDGVHRFDHEWWERDACAVLAEPQP